VEEQERVWALQLGWAAQYGKPLVVHCRKALDRMFRDAKALAQCPAVVFHSFSGSPEEAQSLRKRGINAYFSFGKPLLNGNKRARRCAATLPGEWLLAETDAPWQTPRGETVTRPEEIRRVYAEMAALRGLEVAELQYIMEENFKKAFC
jgi:TatD DNase family protein